VLATVHQLQVACSFSTFANQVKARFESGKDFRANMRRTIRIMRYVSKQEETSPIRLLQELPKELLVSEEIRAFDGPDVNQERLRVFRKSIQRVANGRKVFVTVNGYFGVGQYSVWSRDRVWRRHGMC
jgi:hypothetical protein